MTLEEAGKTRLARAGFKLCAETLKILAFFKPKIASGIATKMRGLFSPRINNILHENIFVHSNFAPDACITPKDIFCHTGLKIDLNLDLRDYTQGHFYFGGLPNFFLDLLAFIDEKTVFFDLGANMGIISASLSKFMPHRQIVAVEALPDTYQRLKGVFDSNCPAASAFNTALSSDQGTLRFNIPSTDSGSSSASLSADELLDARSSSAQVRTREVPCERFDHFYEKIDSGLNLSMFGKHLFKIDVEGHEVELLQGMAKYFSNYTGELMIVIEVRPQTSREVSKILFDNGFHLPKKGKKIDIKTPLNDMIFRRVSKDCLV